LRPVETCYADQPERHFEALEPRLALYAAPFLTDFPDMSEMASAQNTIVRMQTPLGFIDIELYDRAGPTGATAAPNTVENFLRYIAAGRYENVFFHRLVSNFVLQGGGWHLEPGEQTARPVETFSPIADEIDPQRKNETRTIAMALSGPNSATSQFFINLVDNQHLDGQFTVFGRVINGWDVVQTITGLQRRNLTNLLPQGQSGGGFEYPITGSANTDVVSILDIDVIKPAGTDQFFEHALYFPDGYRSGRSTNTVDLVNLDVNVNSRYEVIARFETGARDVVIASGVLEPGAHLSLPIFAAGNPALDKIRGGAPFGYEVRATRPIAASLHHTDFNATTSESFINPRDFDEADLREWSFALGQKGPGVPSFLVWQNISDQPASLTITFVSETGATHQMTQSLDAFRRGGLNLNLVPGVPDGAYSATIASNQPIVAALSQYRTSPGRAAIEMGTIRGGDVQGVLPGALIPGAGQSLISVALPQSPTTPVVIDFQFILSDGTVINSPALFTLDSNMRRRDVDLSAAHGGLPNDDLFTIRYRVRDDAAPVSVSYLSLVHGQTMRSSFQTVSSQEVFFASGFSNPDSPGAAEFISIYNPHVEPGVVMVIRVRFHFADEVVEAHSQALGAGESAHLAIRSLTEVMQRINAGQHAYGITVSADIRKLGHEVPGAIFAQFMRLDELNGTAVSGPTLGTEFPWFFLRDPIFG
jgi:peptidyl-prolyl cis-trans isomerase A (cyclophilin A)